MTRLQKKCFFAAIGTHGLLLLALFVSSAFKPKAVVDDPHVLTMVDAVATDDATHDGSPPAAPTSTPAPAAPPADSAVKPLPPPSKPEVLSPPPEAIKPSEPVKPIVKPMVEDMRGGDLKVTSKKKAAEKPLVVRTHDPKKTKMDSAKKKSETKAMPKAAPNIDISRVVRLDPKAQEAAEAKANEQREKQRRDNLVKEIGNGAGNIARHTAPISDTAISSIGGDGSDGPAMVNYAEFVRATYKAKYDAELLRGGEISDEFAEVHVAITIASDGRVTSSRVTKPSGNTVLDKLVRHMLDSVDQIRSFPPGAKDSERTFNIIFNLKPTRSQG